MYFSPDAIRKLADGYRKIATDAQSLVEAYYLHPYKIERAREFANHGSGNFRPYAFSRRNVAGRSSTWMLRLSSSAKFAICFICLICLRVGLSNLNLCKCTSKTAVVSISAASIGCVGKVLRRSAIGLRAFAILAIWSRISTGTFELSHFSHGSNRVKIAGPEESCFSFLLL
jgi:hypothetical protein